MATTHPPPAPSAAELANGPHSPAGPQTALEKALMPAAQAAEGEMVLSAPAGRLPVELDVSVAVRNFRVRDLLNLQPAQLIESGWGQGDDVPLASGPAQLAWAEFEVIDTQLAVRVTRLA
ncbi:MAG: FliM/FliN family flagellar motor C-terminal domain-containing protein [Terracidiphilus sp.]|nr:FliM/FliN family flagellar motor C-terminal domain-containing protein [Terracidiphilus sp.]